MALLLTGTAQHLDQTPLITAFPFTFECWFQPTATITANETLMALCSTSGTENFYLLGINSTAKLRAFAQTGSSTNSGSNSSASVTTTAYHHAVAVFASASSQQVYLDGVAATAGSGSIAFSGVSLMSLGALYLNTATATQLYKGLIAYAAFRNIALNATDVAFLYNAGVGTDTSLYSSGSVVSFSKMQSGPPYLDTGAGTTWTLTGSPTIVADPFSLGPTAPSQAIAAGLSNLEFSEEFNAAIDIGYGTTGHKWNAGLWWEPVRSPINYLNNGDGTYTIAAIGQPSVVQQVNNWVNATNITTLPTVLGNTVTGDSIIVVVNIYAPSATPTVSGITVSTGAATFTKAVGSVSGVLNTEIWCAPAITGGTTPTLTVNFSGNSNYTQINIYEVSNLDPSGALDGTNSLTGTSFTSSSGSITTTNALDFIVGGNTAGGASGFSGETNWTSVGETGFQIAQYLVPLTTGTYSSTTSSSASGAWNGVIAAFKPNASPTSFPNINLCTQYHDFSGGTYFNGGYFEARLKCTDWSAFWLYCADRPTVFGAGVLPGSPLTWTSEIDIIETDPGVAYTNNVTTTLHKNTGGDGGVPDAQNSNNNNTISNGPVCGAWHVFGVLWTSSNVSWYVDDVLVATTPTYASTNQPMQLILSAQPGGVNGSANSTSPPTTQVDYVRVWGPENAVGISGIIAPTLSTSLTGSVSVTGTTTANPRALTSGTGQITVTGVLKITLASSAVGSVTVTGLTQPSLAPNQTGSIGVSAVLLPTLVLPSFVSGVGITGVTTAQPSAIPLGSGTLGVTGTAAGTHASAILQLTGSTHVTGVLAPALVPLLSGTVGLSAAIAPSLSVSGPGTARVTGASGVQAIAQPQLTGNTQVTGVVAPALAPQMAGAAGITGALSVTLSGTITLSGLTGLVGVAAAIAPSLIVSGSGSAGITGVSSVQAIAQPQLTGNARVTGTIAPALAPQITGAAGVSGTLSVTLSGTISLALTGTVGVTGLIKPTLAEASPGGIGVSGLLSIQFAGTLALSGMTGAIGTAGLVLPSMGLGLSGQMSLLGSVKPSIGFPGQGRVGLSGSMSVTLMGSIIAGGPCPGMKSTVRVLDPKTGTVKLVT